MNTLSINTYYCKFCDWLADKTSQFITHSLQSYKVLALSKAAGELALAGYHDDAQKMAKEISEITGSW